MALKNPLTRTVLVAGLLLVPFIFAFANPISGVVLASREATLPNFADFIKRVENGKVNILSGVYVPDVLALPIVQQPAGDSGYVSARDDETTQFSMAAHYGTIGLLAHNYLSGSSFSGLATGQEVRLVYGDGKVEYFIITEVLRYQALDPYSQWSSFRDLDSHDVLSAEQMFARAYTGERHITFQTCIEASGNASWGRLFVIAVPKSFSFHQLIQQVLQ